MKIAFELKEGDEFTIENVIELKFRYPGKKWEKIINHSPKLHCLTESKYQVLLELCKLKEA